MPLAPSRLKLEPGEAVIDPLLPGVVRIGKKEERKKNMTGSEKDFAVSYTAESTALGGPKPPG